MSDQGNDAHDEARAVDDHEPADGVIGEFCLDLLQ